MLRDVLDGDTYNVVAARHGITRTAVERRVKGIASRVVREVGVSGLAPGGTAFVNRLRQHREALLEALHALPPAGPKSVECRIRIVTSAELDLAVHRVRGRSNQPHRDVALFLLLFATGARPLEIARLEVGDYLQPDGQVRRASQWRAEVAVSARARPLYFRSRQLDDALDKYLAQRVGAGHGIGDAADFRGLDPTSRLFLDPSGSPFRVTRYGPAGQRFLCRPIFEIYRKLFRYADLQGVTPLSVRHTVVARLYGRGADEAQVALILGISDPSAVRDQFPRTRVELDRLVADLV